MEAKTDEEECKHVCRLCNKKYPSGKSLGGHMRSHVITNSYVPLHKLKSKKALTFCKSRNTIKAKKAVVGYGENISSEKEVRYKAIALINSIENGSSSNKSEIDLELENVALCLMMLSRDSSHKRNYLECGSKVVSDDSVDGYVRNCVIKNPKVDGTKNHCCPLCSKVFRSGQALGGHKRSHLIGCSSQDKVNPVQFIEQRNRPLLIDLNLPASLE